MRVLLPLLFLAFGISVGLGCHGYAFREPLVQSRCRKASLRRFLLGRASSHLSQLILHGRCSFPGSRVRGFRAFLHASASSSNLRLLTTLLTSFSSTFQCTSLIVDMSFHRLSRQQHSFLVPFRTLPHLLTPKRQVLHSSDFLIVCLINLAMLYKKVFYSLFSMLQGTKLILMVQFPIFKV
jgi:hypothetical protein